jgi:hypothetical protein
VLRICKQNWQKANTKYFIALIYKIEPTFTLEYTLIIVSELDEAPFNHDLKLKMLLTFGGKRRSCEHE